ncbi:MAG: DUF4337 family protein [Aquabacterium sp.]|nr:DUF4337 family protein [Aquabacterium sp.]
MAIDPQDLLDNARQAAEKTLARDAADAAQARSEARLNATVAITVAVLATFMGICKVKDANIVQAMQQAQAELDQASDDRLNASDDQFDLSDAALAIAIALLAVTAPTGLWPLFWAALVPTFFGVLMGVAGLATLPIHPQMLIKLLS